MPDPFLEILGVDPPRRIEIGSAPVTIGRASSNTLPLPGDHRISRHHCVVTIEGRSARVRDLDSRNGTRVNDQQVKQAELHDGDVVGVGKARLAYHGPAPGELPETADPAPAQSAVARLEQSAGDPNAGVEPDSNTSARPIEVLAPLAEAETPTTFGDAEIALLNSRGQVLHESVESDDDSFRKIGEGVRMLRQLLLICVRTRASDVHLEPREERFLVRLRIDGTMVEAMSLKPAIGRMLQNIVKALCELELTGQGRIQEGHFAARMPDRHVDYRVSFTSAMQGQKLVIRVLDLAHAPTRLKDLGLPEWMLEEVQRTSRRDSGMLLACGPTGSGKTTSLYAALREIDVTRRNVITIEDPIEYRLPGATQLPIDENRGKGFSDLLRSVLRQDPDVLLLGEVRDPETARTAMQAAMTGHLVFSTVHAKDTIGSLFRLLDLGVEPYLVASALNLVLAQRLVRLLCPHCKQEKRPTPDQVNRLGEAGRGLGRLFTPGGCRRCLGTGYAGRQAIFEMLQVNDEVRDVILAEPTIARLREKLGVTFFTPLRTSGCRLVAEGKTSLDEVDRVTDA